MINILCINFMSIAVYRSFVVFVESILLVSDHVLLFHVGCAVCRCVYKLVLLLSCLIDCAVR